MSALKRKDSNQQVAALIQSIAQAAVLKRKHGISGHDKKAAVSSAEKTHTAISLTAMSTG